MKTHEVAVKTLNIHPEFAIEEDMASFYKEIKIHSELKHRKKIITMKSLLLNLFFFRNSKCCNNVWMLQKGRLFISCDGIRIRRRSYMC